MDRILLDSAACTLHGAFACFADHLRLSLRQLLKHFADADRLLRFGGSNLNELHIFLIFRRCSSHGRHLVRQGPQAVQFGYGQDIMLQRRDALIAQIV